MNLKLACQRSASDKKSFYFQDFSHSAGAKTPLPVACLLGDGDLPDTQMLRFRATFSESHPLGSYCLTKVTGTEITALPPSGASN